MPSLEEEPHGGPGNGDALVQLGSNGRSESDGAERAGRPMARSELEEGKRMGHVATRQLQLPSPSPTPPPPSTDPFPLFEATALPPATPDASEALHVLDGFTTRSSDPRSSNTKDRTLQLNTSPKGEEGEDTSTVPARPSALGPEMAGHDTVNTAAEGPAATTKPAGVPKEGNRSRAPSIKKDGEGPRKLSASQMQALATAPDSLPVAVVNSKPVAPLTLARKPNGSEYPVSASVAESSSIPTMAEQLKNGTHNSIAMQNKAPASTPNTATGTRPHALSEADHAAPQSSHNFRRPAPALRTVSTPPISRKPTTAPPVAPTPPNPTRTRRNSFNPSARPPPLNLGTSSNHGPAPQRAPTAAAPQKTETVGSERAERAALEPSPPIMQGAIPLPPMSLHTHLQLELAGVRPSPLYIYRHHAADIPYESSAVKFERLLNVLYLPPYLEATLTFGALACLDAFLYTFTLLPLRFVLAIGVLVKWWAYILWKESKWLVGFVYQGLGRLWQRGRRGRSQSRLARHGREGSQTASETERSQSRARAPSHATQDAHTTAAQEIFHLNVNAGLHPPKHALPRSTPTGAYRHRRTKSMPSNLTSFHKADLLQGAVIICSSLALMSVDASRMYHFIRAQSAMKLYVIYNLLEVGDRLLSAIGQDILECLFSAETLSRNSSGRSKLLLPFGMFLLSLAYNVVHAVCLFYQVITLNVAVNSYSNALLSLLMSNQFVEIKGSVFKKIEKENLFQLTCADVVERFQLWIILIIIGLRNIVEVGGLSVPGAGSEAENMASGPGPLHTASILPASFTILPSWMFSGEVLSPFLVVIGSEMLVDWIKHGYINKFNNVKPNIYRRMLDILCKDYYTNAFGAPALTRRIGLPLLPLSCLFIRASVQIYNMFLATQLPPPIPTSTMDLSVESSTPSSPAMTAALEHLDTLIRNALGRAVYGYPRDTPRNGSFWAFNSDDAIALATGFAVFFLAWLVLLVVKLLLGMALLKYSRDRYAAIRLKEQSIANGQEKRDNFFQPGKRVGGYGAVELGDDRRRMIYADDPEGLKRMQDRDRKSNDLAKKTEAGDDGLEKVTRYEMLAKRIW